MFCSPLLLLYSRIQSQSVNEWVTARNLFFFSWSAAAVVPWLWRPWSRDPSTEVEALLNSKKTGLIDRAEWRLTDWLTGLTCLRRSALYQLLFVGFMCLSFNFIICSCNKSCKRWRKRSRHLTWIPCMWEIWGRDHSEEQMRRRKVIKILKRGGGGRDDEFWIPRLPSCSNHCRNVWWDDFLAYFSFLSGKKSLLPSPGIIFRLLYS